MPDSLLDLLVNVDYCRPLGLFAELETDEGAGNIVALGNFGAINDGGAEELCGCTQFL